MSANAAASKSPVLASIRRTKTHVSGGIYGNSADEFGARHLKDRKAALIRLASDDDVSSLQWCPCDLEIHAELIAPQPGDLGEGIAATRHYLGDSNGLVLCVLPRFQPDRAAEQRIKMFCYIAGRKYGAVVCRAELVNNDAVVYLETRVGG